MLFGRKQAGVEWIVVLLGNPGQRFTGTRHNVGFMTGDALERLLDVKIDRIKFKALVRQVKIDGRGVLLMKPQTYMNLSGDAVQQAMAFYKVALDHVIVVSDDISLPVGKLRVRRSGSAGGHNGLKDIIAKCGGEGFPRVKIGVGAKPNPEMDMADWVLSTFKNGDAEEIERAVKSAAEAVLSVICEGVDKAMNKFN
jgi:PTH1 family peptidyl-tRNA hydrolase